MRLVLGAGLNPRNAKKGPKVRLFAGSYRLAVENYKDSDIVLHSDSGMKGVEFESKGENFWYEIAKPGTESHLNIFVEVVNGPNATAITR